VGGGWGVSRSEGGGGAKKKNTFCVVIYIFAPLAASLSLSRARARALFLGATSYMRTQMEVSVEHRQYLYSCTSKSKFTCITSTKAAVTCCTSTRVQILTQDRTLKHAHANGSLLALPVQK
jgi:hypothetical protein